MTDPIADFLTRIRNAQGAGSISVSMPHSNTKESIAKVMKKNNFLTKITVAEENKKKMLVLELPKKKLTLKRVSRPGQRITVGASEIRKVLNGLGISVVSTSKGIITGYEARSLNVGGEILCEVS